MDRIKGLGAVLVQGMGFIVNLGGMLLNVGSRGLGSALRLCKGCCCVRKLLAGRWRWQCALAKLAPFEI